MNIGKSFTYIFDDPRWLNKILIGTLVFIASSLLSVILVGLLGYFIIMGYALEVVRNVRRGDRNPLPEWKDRWGEWLVLGVKLTVALLVWAIPAILIGLVMVVPAAMTGGDDTLAAVGGLAVACLSCLVLLWSVVVLLVSPAIYIRVSESEQISSAFQFGDILRFTREHLGDVIIVTILYFVASLVFGLIGSVAGILLCGIGLFVTLPAAQLVTMLVQSHLYAQVGIDKAVLQSWAYGLPESQPSQAVAPVSPPPADVAPRIEPQLPPPPTPLAPEPSTLDDPAL